MHFVMESIQGALVLRVDGEIDLKESDELRDQIDRRLEKERPSIFVVDLKGTTFIDSSGIGLLLGRYKRINGWGGKMYIVGARPPVERLLRISGITRLIPIDVSEKDVLRVVKRGANHVKR